MDGFKTFLKESNISYNEALTFLGLDAGYSLNDLKNAHRAAISKYHTDREGGSVGLAKMANTARDLLKKQINSSTQETAPRDFEERERNFVTAAQFIIADLVAKFQPDAFIKYFTEEFKQDFKSTVEFRKIPLNGRGITSTGFSARFATADDKIVFEYKVYVDLIDVVYGKNDKLSSNPDISYSIQVTAFGYANRKKQKMSQRDWKSGNNHVVLSDPKKSFPAAKMKKIASASNSGVMKRADFALALKNEVKAKIFGDPNNYMIPLKDGSSVHVYRITFLRKAQWQLFRIGKLGKVTMTDFEYLSGSLPETETTLDLFLDITKMNSVNATKAIEKAYKTYIGK